MSYTWGSPTAGISPADLAEDLGMLQDDDVRYLLTEHLGVDVHDDLIPNPLAAELRRILDVDGVRTADASLYWANHIRPPAQGQAFTSATGDQEPVWLWPDEEPPTF